MMLSYVDPSVMSYTIQALAGVAIALGVVFGVVWRKVKRGLENIAEVLADSNSKGNKYYLFEQPEKQIEKIKCIRQ